jgi:hypothetical protein
VSIAVANRLAPRKLFLCIRFMLFLLEKTITPLFGTRWHTALKRSLRGDVQHENPPGVTERWPSGGREVIEP